MRGLKFSIPYVYVFSFWVLVFIYMSIHIPLMTFPMSLYDVPAHFLNL